MIAAVLLEAVSLEKLYLSNTSLNVAKATKINNALSNISSLKVFNISKNNIADRATDSIADVIRSNSSIENVNISFNKLSYSGVLNIVSAFLLTKSIKVFDISNNLITSDNVVDLATALSTCPTLQELNISRNLLQITNVLTIARYFRYHPTLQCLNLSSNIDSFSSACEFIVDVILSVNKTLINLNVCGRNIRPRYIEDYLSPPSSEHDSPELTFQDLYLLQHSLLDVPTNFIKATETCPIFSEDMISYYVDHLGGVFYNQYHNFAIVIPPGAVSQEDCVEIQATANCFGPYIIPNEFYPISSYFWVTANYKFKAPVYLIMNHHAKLRNLEDVSNLHVLQTCAHVKDDNLIMSKVSEGAYFDNEIRYCVLATDHFCSFCQAKSIKEIPEHFLACYCTYDDCFSGSYIAEVCFCPSNSDCRKVSKYCYQEFIVYVHM